MSIDHPNDELRPSTDGYGPDRLDGCDRPVLAGSGAVRTPMVLIVAADAARRAALSRMIRSEAVVCRLVNDAQTALRLIEVLSGSQGVGIDCLVLDTNACDQASKVLVSAARGFGVGSLIICPDVSFDQAVEAMRAGATDIVGSGVKPAELCRRVRAILVQSLRLAERAVSNGPRAAGTLSADSYPIAKASAAARGKTPQQRSRVGARRDGSPLTLTGSPENLSARALAGVTEDFQLAVRHELDIEMLLRTALEFVLQQAGPTNAAVFLPGTSGDYALGAYVNLSCPKETAEMLMDHLAHVSAPKLESLPQLTCGSGPRAVQKLLGQGATWIDDGHAAAFCCRHGGETLAIFVLFRGIEAAFTPHVQTVLAAIAPVFGEQLARVVRIHHRHLPKDKWGALGDATTGADDDSGGLAA